MIRFATGPGALFNLLLIFSGVGGLLLTAGMWLFLNWHENDVKDEIKAQHGFVNDMIEKFIDKLCEAGNSGFDDDMLENMQEDGLYASNMKKKSYQNISTYAKHLEEFLVLDKQTEQSPCKTVNADVEWLAVEGKPEELGKPSGWDKREYYTLMGFVTIKPMSVDLFSKTPENAFEKWMIVYVPATRLVTSGSRFVVFVWAFAIFNTLLLLIALLVLRVTKPLKYLKDALDEFYGTVAAEEASPSEIMVNLQNLVTKIDTDTLSEHEAIRSFHTMRRQLRKILLFQQEMMAGLSHDLRTGAIGLIYHIKKLQDPYQQENLLESAKFMQGIADDTLYILTGEGVQKPLEKHDLYSLITMVVDHIEKDDKGKVDSERIRIDTGADRIVVLAQERALIRAFENLVRNALLYGGGAEISMRTEEERWAVVDIADRGPGMPEDIDVQKPFVRGDLERNILAGGSGLGLNIAKDNIQSHGGAVEHLDREGGGTIARVKLPLAT